MPRIQDPYRNKILHRSAGEPNTHTFKHKGLTCHIERHKDFLHLCGYVGVGKEHPFHGKDYSTKVKCNAEGVSFNRNYIGLLCASLEDRESDEWPIDLLAPVHGGITFTNWAYWNKEPDNLWYFGFDCSHHGDMTTLHNGTYRTFEEVTEDCKDLAEFLEKLEQERPKS